MKTPICPTCGCSLVRLGISKDQAVASQGYSFCCQGCAELFRSSPQKYVREMEDTIVCPTCLAEKPREFTDCFEIAGRKVWFCHCPCCPEAYRKDPDYYLKRLRGEVPYAGVFTRLLNDSS